MLMKRARAYGSSCSEVILVYLHPFRRNSLFCNRKSPKNYLKSIFLKFKVIEGHRCYIRKKLVVSACYDKQHGCANLQPFAR